MKRWSCLIACGLLLDLYGCGRTDLLFDEDDGSDGIEEPDAGVGPAPDSSTIIDAGGPDVTTVPDAVADSRPGRDTGGDTAVGPPDAGRPPPDAGGPMDAGRVDAQPPPTRGTIPCGATACTAGSQECCVTLGGAGGLATPTCTAVNACPAGLSLGCASDANCARGQVCCLSLGAQGATCAPTCGMGVNPGIQLCTGNAGCPAGETCQMALFGLSICLPGGIGPGGGPGRCASPDTPIATPEGERPISDIRAGDIVYSVDHDAVRPVVVLRAGHVHVDHHQVVQVRFEDGRTLEISAPHPTADGRTFGDLRPGGWLDGHRIDSVAVVPYAHDETYDLLPASDTGTYFAAGVRIGSTLSPVQRSSDR